MADHGMRGLPPIVRLFDQAVIDDRGCWLYTGYIDEGGYSQILVDGERVYRHVAAYRLFVGPVPAGHQLDHLCRRPACFNPACLEPVTARVNNLRSGSWGGVNARKDHCPVGHPYDAENTYAHHGRRHCRACRRVTALAYYHRKRELVAS